MSESLFIIEYESQLQVFFSSGRIVSFNERDKNKYKGHKYNIYRNFQSVYIYTLQSSKINNEIKQSGIKIWCINDRLAVDSWTLNK